jgi:carboxypeptidase C (cathepsin A)
MQKSLVLSLFLALLAMSYAANCPEKDDIVTDLPNFDHNYNFPCTYTGFVTVDEPTDSNLFYWFFRDEALDDNAPFVLWINGGPGSSSSFGNLIENGPFKLVKDQSGVIKVHSLTGQAWNAVANIVYLDQPVGVGYSYGHLNITDVSQVKAHTLLFLKGFYEKHPEMKRRNFFITGESYGGKYEPAMASAIIDYNAEADEEDKIPLKGVLIGNGFVDPVTQRLSIRHLSLALGSIQFDSIPELDTMEQRCQAANGRKDVDAPDICGAVSGFVSHMDGGMDMYDSRWPSSNSTSQDELVNEYLNYPEVVAKLHCDVSTKEIKFALGNNTVGDNYDINDGMLRYIDEHQKILDNDITLLIFVGQFDRKDGPYGVQEWMKKLKWDGMSAFYASSRNLYFYVSDDDGDIRLGGNYKKYKNLNVFMIYAAGHMVPSTQLATSRSMLSDIMFNGGLQCHHADGKCSLDQFTCSLMKNCNGNGN